MNRRASSTLGRRAQPHSTTFTRRSPLLPPTFTTGPSGRMRRPPIPQSIGQPSFSWCRRPPPLTLSRSMADSSGAGRRHYSAKRSTLPRRVIIYDVSASGTTLWGQMTVTGWMGGGSYDFTVEEGGPTGEIYNFNNGTGLTEPSQLPPPPCYTYPCNVTGPYTAQLTPTGNPSSGIISFGFEDQGETFSATGTLTPVTSATGTLDLVTTGVTAGVPEASTWAMMLLGLGGLGVAGFRRTREKAGAALADALGVTRTAGQSRAA
jgi:hypothetical protein